MKSKNQDAINKKNLIIKIVLIVIIIILLIHNCVLLKENEKYQNNPSPNGNVDIIDIKCEDNGCKPVITPTTKPSGDKKTITPVSNEITGLSFTEKNISITNGDSLNLVVIVNPRQLSSSKLEWSSSDPSVVSVDESGKITGLAIGTATITVKSSNGKSATIKITVTEKNVEVEKIELSPSKVEVGVDLTEQIIATIKPENATNRDLIWTSADSSIAKVDNKGVVTGVKVGNTKITVKTKDGKVIATIDVEVDNDDETDDFKVYDKDKKPVNWNGSTNLKIFTKSIYNVDGVIAPESENTYEFIVKNSTDYNIKYNVEFNETNDYNINMKYKLKKNGTYIIDHYVDANELNITNQLLNTNNKDTYQLEWKWVSSTNDTSIGTNPEAVYGLQIEVKAESINE